MGAPGIRDLLRLLAEQAREHAVIFLGADGRILWWSNSAADIFGQTAEEARGRHLSELFVPEDRAQGLPALELDIARVNGAAENDRWLLRSDGSRFWASGATTALRDEDGNVLAFGKILRNRTDGKEQLETLRNQLETLTREHEQKNVFLSTLSHELRNPLAPLSNAVELLRLAAPDVSGLQYPINMIERQVAFIQRLVDDLLDVTRIGVGKLELQTEPIVIQTALQKALDDLATSVQQHRHKVELLTPPTPIVVSGDTHRLHQVFLNLLGNAVKYTPPEGRIWIKATTEGSEAVVRFEDTGVGIPAEMQPSIFELFTQVEGTRPQSEGGLGIGLSLVKRLVTLHGGSVQVASDGVGKGSEFTVRLPLRV